METKKLHGVWAGPMVAEDLKVGQVVRDRMSSFHPAGKVVQWTEEGNVFVEFGSESLAAACWLPVRDLDLYVSVGEGTVTP